ncbi:MAG: aminodeoxychorismate synthase component I [Halioglobus sp.]
MKKSVHIEEIPYLADSCALFERVREMPGAVMLDSCFPHAQSGRFDILSAEPMEDLPPPPPTAVNESECRAYFDELRRFHAAHFTGIQPVSEDVPFCGGVLGYLGYEFGNGLQDVAVSADAIAEPTCLNAYEWCVLQDHLLGRALLITLPWVSATRRQQLLERLLRPCTVDAQPFALAGPFQCDSEVEVYRQQFAAIQSYIQAGDCYQVNLARHFSARCEGDPWLAYRALRPAAEAPFSAFLSLADGGALLSLSPERFLSLHGHRVETSPIKGTRPRYADPQADRLAAQDLRNSAKDRAENLMIVDLLRNDLGRSCVPGSILVDRLFEVQSYATVHHLVSTISGELQPGRTAWELLRDSFPGGSITGAPKRRAMQIIAELESVARGPYCGSILYVSADGRMDSNIAIRSLLCRDDTLHCWGGGGIVADSQWQSEYQETWDKVGKFLTLLENLPAKG